MYITPTDNKLKGNAMTDIAETTEENTCPECGSHEVEWVHTQSNGHDVSFMMCFNCDTQFGGDL